MAANADGAVAASDVNILANPTSTLLGGSLYGTVAQGGDAVVLPRSSTDPASWLPMFLYFVQNGVDFGSWGYVGLSLLLQTTGATGAAGSVVGAGLWDAQSTTGSAADGSASAMNPSTNQAVPAPLGETTTSNGIARTPPASLFADQGNADGSSDSPLAGAAGSGGATSNEGAASGGVQGGSSTPLGPNSMSAAGVLAQTNNLLSTILSGGPQETPPPFIYQDVVGADPWLNDTQANGIATPSDNSWFSEWAALLDPHLASAQSIFGALDVVGGAMDSTLAAADLAQGQLGGSASNSI